MKVKLLSVLFAASLVLTGCSSDDNPVVPEKTTGTVKTVILSETNSSAIAGANVVLYNADNNTMHTELTAKFGKENIKPMVQLVGTGPIDNPEGKVLLGLELTPKK